MHRLFNHLFAAFIITFYVATSIVLAIPVIIAAILAYLLPVKWCQAVIKILLRVPVLWTSFSNLILRSRSHEWKIHGEVDLNPRQWYMLISNHLSAVDILVLGYVFNHKSSPIKFLMKRQLLWQLPLVGLGCWLLGYPFMRRHSTKTVLKRPKLKGKDIETTKKASGKVREFPTTIISFVEGTRFTVAKHKRQAPNYSYLLRPKAGGVAAVVEQLHDKLAGILNVTIHYSKPLSLWGYFAGNPCEITVHYELLPLTADLIGDYHQDREFRLHFQQWLNSVWKRKDLLFEKLQQGESE